MKDDRRKIILQKLESEGIVYLSKLSEMFPNVSVMTLRRDLDYFEQSGIANRLHGGAQKKTAGSEPFYNMRANKCRAEKELIARLATSFIAENNSIFIDCGTTAMELAKAVPDIKLTVFTNAPNVGIELSKKNNINVIILGGKLNKDNYSLTGRLTENQLESFNIDVAFVCASGYTVSGGFTCGSFDEAELKRKILSKAQKRLILMDSSKFGKNFMTTFARVDDIDALITDCVPNDEIRSGIADANVLIIDGNQS